MRKFLATHQTRGIWLLIMVFGGLFLLLFWFVYGILIFFIPFILYAIMKNTTNR